MFWLKRVIHAVPSACSRWPPVGSGALRSKTPMLSRPRKPPSKTFLSKRSLRFTHQVKLRRSLWKADFRNARSTSPRLFITREKEGGPGMDRRVHIAKVPLVGRDLAVGMEIGPGEHEVQLLL